MPCFYDKHVSVLELITRCNVLAGRRLSSQTEVLLTMAVMKRSSIAAIMLGLSSPVRHP